MVLRLLPAICRKLYSDIALHTIINPISTRPRRRVPGHARHHSLTLSRLPILPAPDLSACSDCAEYLLAPAAPAASSTAIYLILCRQQRPLC